MVSLTFIISYHERCMIQQEYQLQWRIQDFYQGRDTIILKLQRKLHEIKENWAPWGGASHAAPPLDPLLNYSYFNCLMVEENRDY